MKYETIVKARRQLNSARISLDMLRAVQGYDVEAYHFHWHNALMNLGAIIEILRTSARERNPKAKQWVNGKFKNEILKDPLLKFMYHARGTDHHGTAHSASLTNGTQTIPYIGEGSITLSSLDGTQSVMRGIIVMEGPSVNVGETIDEFSFVLIDVTNEKYGDIFPVPTTHFHDRIPNRLAITAGDLTHQYYQKILDEAEAEFFSG